MKKKIIYLTGLAIFIVVSFIFTSCKKDKQDKDTKAAENNAMAENVFSDVFKQVKESATSDTNVARYAHKGEKTGCAILSVSPIGWGVWPKTLTIDFGSTNCQGYDGYWRRGKIIAVFSGKWEDSLTTVNVSVDNYYVNDNHVQGTKTITNKGHIGTTNGTHNLVYEVVVSNGVITTTDGTISWSTTRTNEWTEGEGTPWPNVFDDVYLIRGNAAGTDVNGNSFTINITEALRVQIGCRWIESGKLEIIPQGLPTRTVDYGSGSCDNQATVTINGIVYNIVMQ